jgi:hypothetical protein
VATRSLRQFEYKLRVCHGTLCEILHRKARYYRRRETQEEKMKRDPRKISQLIVSREKLFRRDPSSFHRLASRISVGKTLCWCPYCDATRKIVNGKLARHGYKFEVDDGVYQSKKGNEQYGECPGSGIQIQDAPHDTKEAVENIA